LSSILIRSNWHYLWESVWVPIRKKSYATDNMFVELYERQCRKLKLNIVRAVYDDQKIALKEFKKQFVSLEEPTEQTCIELLEDFYGILSNNDARLCFDYRVLLEKFVHRYNLRYFVTADCKIRLSLVGLMISQYATLKKTLSNNQLRSACLTHLEANVGLFHEDIGEENCIRAANNLLEGVAIDKANDGSKTLGAALNAKAFKDCFPHEALIEPTDAFWKFSCDFPNLRHAGMQQNVYAGVKQKQKQILKPIRPIKKEDAILTLSYAVILATFIADNNSSKTILSGEF
jgi:hypothetical protein